MLLYINICIEVYRFSFKWTEFISNLMSCFTLTLHLWQTCYSLHYSTVMNNLVSLSHLTYTFLETEALEKTLIDPGRTCKLYREKTSTALL